MADRKKSGLSRREMLKRAGFTAAGAGFVPASALAQQAQPHEHQHKAQGDHKPAGPYERKYFNEHEFKTLQALSDWIIPPDEKSQGGIAGGTAELIDLMADVREELQVSFSGGLGWLDNQMRRRVGKLFIEATKDEQRQMLDLMAYRKNESPELGPGIEFFSLMREWTVDAFYTSKEGIQDVDYGGNEALSEYHGCGEDVVKQLLDRAPV